MKKIATNIIWDLESDDDDAVLPMEIEIPDEMEDVDEISDYLSDLTGYCHRGFSIEEEDACEP